MPFVFVKIVLGWRPRMILDISRFVENERPHWTALEKSLAWLEVNPQARLKLTEVENLHGLYQRASVDLARVPDG